MGKPDMNKKINVFHIVEFALSVAVALCIADNVCIGCGKHVIEMQLVTTSAFGFLMIMSVIFLCMFLDEYISEKMDLCFDAMGGAMCVISAILVLIYATDNSNAMENYNYYRLLIGGACFAANGIMFFLEFFLLVFHKCGLGE